MKASMRGAVDPYGIGLVIVIISAFFAGTEHKESQQQASQQTEMLEQADAASVTTQPDK